ncbi:6-pyruvoyl tetrahydropterin synthase [candidate division KSB1 bacterium RBG_16_48_16]|nr:MAG: 6-pyruvoyl tetrahydropterin synthase [candidate division KSB1 bacterium RBG_16_48_16]
MYKLCLHRDFIASHFLIGGDWGNENFPHPHHYTLEVLLHGDALDRHGYLVDIVELEARLDELVGLFRHKTLNDFPEFDGLNPSLEHFCRIVWEKLSRHPNAPNLRALEIKLWEDDLAWASYTGQL